MAPCSSVVQLLFKTNVNCYTGSNYVEDRKFAYDTKEAPIEVFTENFRLKQEETESKTERQKNQIWSNFKSSQPVFEGLFREITNMEPKPSIPHKQIDEPVFWGRMKGLKRGVSASFRLYMPHKIKVKKHK